MKKGEQPQLDSNWWEKNKGKHHPQVDARSLRQGLRGQGKHLRHVPRRDDEGVLETLDDISKEAKRLSGACNKKLHAETIECLQKFDGVIERYRGPIKKRLEKVEEAPGRAG